MEDAVTKTFCFLPNEHHAKACPFLHPTTRKADNDFF